MIQAMRLLIVTGISVGLVACHSNPNTSTADTSVVVAKVDSPTVTQADTAGLAAFKAEKKARYEDSLKNVGAKRERSRTRTRSSSYAASGYGANSSSNGGYSSNTAAATPVKKSHAARNGALIGAGAGAITGALVTKHNKGVGALIGGVAGGAAGYGVGKIVEKKKEKNQ